MKSPLAAKIAARYLFAKKSYSAINIISVISTCGIAIATMAIICVLSVFNGFHEIIAGKLDRLSPDIEITPASGKTIAEADRLVDSLENFPGIDIAMLSIEDNALAIVGNRQLPVNLKGVEASKFNRITSIENLITPGGYYSLKTDPLTDNSSSQHADNSEDFTASTTTENLDINALFASAEELYYDDIPDELPEYEALISIGTAMSLSVNPADFRPVHIYAPRRKGKISMSNPAISFRHDSLYISGIYQAEQYELDKNSVIVDIDIARDIFQYTDQAGAIEIKIADDADPAEITHRLQSYLGSDYIVKDRLEQHSVNFRMINIEKWITFMLLAFILLIASFNIISTIYMLILDKTDQITTLHRIGASKATIGKIFCWESILINILGAIGGIIIGITLCLIQQQFGIIKLNDSENNLIISAYPVKVELFDIFMVLIPIAIIGAIAASIASKYAKSRIAKA